MLTSQQVSIQDPNAVPDLDYQLLFDVTDSKTTPTTAVKPIANPHAPITITAQPSTLVESKESLTLDKIIIKSSIVCKDSNEQAKLIAEKFNARRQTSSIEKSNVRGSRINPGTFLLITRNNIPEMALSSESQLALPLATPPGTTISAKGIYSFNEVYVSAGGTHYINVPVGKLAKVISNNKPLLLGEGPHVIHDPTLIFDKNTGLVNMTDFYIKHGTVHIITVPAGKIAKAWIGGEPKLLEYQKEPYIFNSPFFTLVPGQGNSYLVDASEQIVIHGSIKRIIPRTGEVAITYNNGELDVIPPAKGKLCVINSANHHFDSFLSTTVQTLIFPSEATKRQRLADNRNATSDEISYEIFTTKDSLKVGVKLLVAYVIHNPSVAVSRLGTTEDIIKHIENIATVDMGKVIQQCTAMEFLSSAQTKPKNNKNEQKNSNLPSAPELLTFQDEVREQLGKDLHEYGIELVRLNIETPKIIDSKIADEMAKQSLLTAQTSARAAVIDTQTALARQEAEQRAQVESIAQKQINVNLVNAAQTRLEAARIDAEAIKSKAQAEADALKIKAQAEADAMLAKARAEVETMNLRGKAYQTYSALVELERTKLTCDAIQKANMFVTPEELRGLFLPGMGMFNQALVRPMSLPLPTQAAKQPENVRDAKLAS